MKKVFVMLALISIALFAAANVSADTYRAVVINPAGFCALFDGNGDAYSTEDTMVVASHSNNGNTKLTCKAKGIPNDEGMAVHWDFDNTGALCGIISPHGPLFTDDWFTVVSASGNATLTCFYTIPED